jgi:hypothetical protein
VDPGLSRVAKLDLVLKDRGRWGTLTCDISAPEDRALSLIELQSRLPQPVIEAARGANRWRRYQESKLFPYWAWACKAEGSNDPSPLRAELDSGAQGRLTEDGRFMRSTGEACAIDSVTLARIEGVSPTGQLGTARDALERFPIANCDPARSSWLSAAKPAPRGKL